VNRKRFLAEALGARRGEGAEGKKGLVVFGQRLALGFCGDAEEDEDNADGWEDGDPADAAQEGP
jgi:hypothetical protein